MEERVPTLKEKLTMTLLDDWKWVATKAWSMRLTALAAVLSGCEVVMQFMAPAGHQPWFAVAAGLVSIAAAYARLVAQRPSQDTTREV